MAAFKRPHGKQMFPLWKRKGFHQKKQQNFYPAVDNLLSTAGSREEVVSVLAWEVPEGRNHPDPWSAFWKQRADGRHEIAKKQPHTETNLSPWLNRKLDGLDEGAHAGGPPPASAAPRRSMTKSEPARSDQPSSVSRDTVQPWTASDAPLRQTRPQSSAARLVPRGPRQRERSLTCGGEARRPAAPPWSTTPPRWSAFLLGGGKKKRKGDARWRRGASAPLPPAGTVERVHVQNHGALPLDGGPLQLGGGVEPGRRSRQLQRGQQLVLAERAVHPRSLVGHVPGGRGARR